MALPKLTLFKKKQAREVEDPKTKKQEGAADAKPSAEKLAEGMVNVKDIIAPPAIEVDFNFLKIGNTYYRTLFVSGYPRFVGANWLSPVINFEHSLDISMFYYPVESKGVLDDLRRKITEMEATVMTNREKGKISDPAVEIALDDAKALQEQLVKGVEKFFQFSFYITIPAESLEELNAITKKLESTLGSLLLLSKTATLQMEDAFQSTIPDGMDKMLITRNMDTTSLATTFPFTSSDLTSDEGIMYGINRNNGSLVVFDRFSLENANSVVFAKSGSGKSYFVKLEALRLMVFGADVIIIDPEEEYRTLCEVVGGNYISFSSNSPDKMNPFDLSGIATEGENELGQKLLSLHTLFKLMFGELTPTEEAILDRALIETYRIKGITTDPETQRNNEPPVMEDLYKVLRGADEKEARGMAERLEKYIKGSLTGIFDQQSTINIDSKMMIFSTRNLEDVLRPIAYYIILDFVWTRIKKDLKKRILIVEEAWSLLSNEDSARFIYGVAKRARKYYLGLTTISQDVDDFLTSEYGKAIVTNSAIQVLLKQHPAAIDRVAETFYLSEGEKRLLLAADIGEGLFFAGANHVSIKVKASEEEHKLITTNPQEVLKLKEEREARKRQEQAEGKTIYKPIERFDQKLPNKTQETQQVTPPTQTQSTPQKPENNSVSGNTSVQMQDIQNQNSEAPASFAQQMLNKNKVPDLPQKPMMEQKTTQQPMQNQQEIKTEQVTNENAPKQTQEDLAKKTVNDYLNRNAQQVDEPQAEKTVSQELNTPSTQIQNNTPNTNETTQDNNQTQNNNQQDTQKKSINDYINKPNLQQQPTQTTQQEQQLQTKTQQTIPQQNDTNTQTKEGGNIELKKDLDLDFDLR